MDYLSIKTKKDKLEYARNELKNRFFGIDFIIDDVINRISSWFIFPDLNTRPAILCLWGMTGVGKTDLIRNLTSLLDLGEHFHEIQLSGGNGQSNTISGVLKYSKIQPKQQGILLLDEIQRYRTVSENGDEKNEYQYSDIWMLLSDGKLPASSAIDDVFDLLLDVKTHEAKQGKKKHSTDPIGRILGKIEKGEDIEEDEFSISQWRAKNLKKDLNLEESIDQIMKWTSHEVQSLLNKIQAEDFLTRSYEDYSKLLIVISGNLDEAFIEAFGVDDVDMDADLMHELTKRVNMLTIKGALLERFKPEQIARFGNNHITYPTLSSEAFTKIIERAIIRYFSFLHEKSGIEVTLEDDSIIKFIYQNSVFPSQGTRPVLSTISDVTNVCFPPIILNALETNVNKLSIRLEDSHVVSSNGDKVYYKADIDQIRKQTSKDTNLQSLIAVHEAGHAIMHMLSYKKSPFNLKLHNNSQGGATWVSKVISSKAVLLTNTQVLYAGQVAEKLIFGDDNISAGSSQDIRVATNKLADMFRSNGLLEGVHTSIIHESHPEAYMFDMDTVDTNTAIQNFAKKAYDETVECLTNYKEQIIKLARILREQRKMTSAEIAAFGNENLGIVVTAVHEDEVNTLLYPYSYDDALTKWK